ncbi:MAG: 4Fe-4S dicluster domain-containing protein [Alphaproteobacteria bacterium]|nr:4Fe-4S dicluster domain-containing protein [Alphaproteobacteria bacterium]
MNKVIINKKRCDISPACGGIEVCPTGAIYWDDANSDIGIDNSKCIGCGQCENACPVKVIRLAKTVADEERIQKEIDEDTTTGLRVDRYGADFVDTKESQSPLTEIMPIGLTVVELNNEESINCLLMSIPMHELFQGEWRHVKTMNPSDELLFGLDVSKLPALVLFKDGQKVGKIEGFFENSESEIALLKKKISEVI